MKNLNRVIFGILSIFIAFIIAVINPFSAGIANVNDNVPALKSTQNLTKNNQHDTENQLHDIKDQQCDKVSRSGVESPCKPVLNAPSPISGVEVLPQAKNDDGTAKTIFTYTPDENKVSHDDKTGINFVNNILILFFKTGTSNQRRLEIIETVGGKCVGFMDVVNQWQVEVKSDSYDNLRILCEKLLSFDEVTFANVEGAKKIRTSAIPNDPFEESAWSEDAPAGSNWGQEAIELPSAWEYKSYFNPIKIGVVDDGFETTHEDLIGVIQFPDAEAQSMNVPSMHGTNVSGIIGAVANNSKGFAGVLWDTTILAYDVIPTETQTWECDTKTFEGFVKCVERGAKIVNFSLGDIIVDGLLPSASSIAFEAETSSQYMAQLLNAGYDFVVVQACGNGTVSMVSLDAIYNGLFCCITDDNTKQSPDMAKKINDRIIIVGAAKNITMGGVRKVYQQPFFSNAGNQVDLCAPGYAIYTSSTGNSYMKATGTSVAAPFVTGVAGLIWSINSNLTGAQVRSIICDPQNQPYIVSDSTDAKHPLVNSYGMLNAKLCVESAIKTLNVNITIPSGSTAVIDEKNSIIYGLAENLSEEELTTRYINAPAGTKFVFSYGENLSLGTGTKVDLVSVSTGKILSTYYIVIVGDITGDGVINSSDTPYLSAITAYLFSVKYKSPAWFASDLTGDGIVNSSDAAMLTAATAHLTTIDQNAPYNSAQAAM